jgi:hypothetical protein
MTIRGFFGKWKQIIHFDWEKQPSYYDVLNIIGELSHIGLDVRAFVSDMGPKNQGLWKEMDVGKVKNGEINKTWFLHPVSDKRVFVFPDFPHLLKLLRNHLFDSGMYFPDGEILNKELYEDLLKINPVQENEFSMIPKFTHKHIYMKGQQRQNVRTAFQTFSNRIS